MLYFYQITVQLRNSYLVSLWFGWRGGIGAALLASLTYLPHIALHWQHQNYDYALNNMPRSRYFLLSAR